jgi:ribonuclease-3
MLKLQERLSYVFSDKRLLKQALTHRSFGENHNERLEFLGDAFLNITAASWLYQRLADQPEGVLTRARAALVKKESLVEYASVLELGKFLILGSGEVKAKEVTPSLIADAFEAIWGALFLDAGFPKAYELFVNHFSPIMGANLDHWIQKDAKSLLQEYGQKNYQLTPVYTVLRQDGMSHQPIFTISCSLGPYQATAVAPSKKQAELAAAQLILSKIEQLS